MAYDPSSGRYGADETRLALNGTYEVPSSEGPVMCRPVFDRLADECGRMPPEAAEIVTGVPAAQIVEATRTLWSSRPVAFYAWSGLEQHSNVTQTVRAIGVLYALTGCLDAPGGNVLFASVPANRIDGIEFLSPEQRAKAIGVDQRPLGPARFEFVTGQDFYGAALAGRARALVNFGSNLVMAHGDSARGRDALAALDFFVHADLFMSPTAELADIVLPATSPFEAEALRIGFESSQAAQSLIQLRTPLTAARGEARSDLQIIFALAVRARAGQAVLRRRHRGRAPVPAGTQRRHPRAPACQPGRRADAANDAPPEVRGVGWVPHAHRQDRAVLGDVPVRRPLATAILRRTRNQSALASRPGRALPARPDVCEVAVVLRVAASQHRQCAEQSTRTAGRDPSRRG